LAFYCCLLFSSLWLGPFWLSQLVSSFHLDFALISTQSIFSNSKLSSYDLWFLLLQVLIICIYFLTMQLFYFLKMNLYSMKHDQNFLRSCVCWGTDTRDGGRHLFLLPKTRSSYLLFGVVYLCKCCDCDQVGGIFVTFSASSSS